MSRAPGLPKGWRCLVSLLLAVAFVALLAAAVALPVMAKHGEYRDGIETARRDVLRYRRIIAEAPVLREEIARLRDTTDSASYYLAQSARALAAAELQEKAKQVVERGGGSLTSTQVLPMRGERGQVTVRVQMSGDAEALQRVLYSLEAGQPLLFVNRLNVRSSVRRTRRRSSKDRRPPAPGPTILTIGFDLSGYMDIDRSSGEAGPDGTG